MDERSLVHAGRRAVRLLSVLFVLWTGHAWAGGLALDVSRMGAESVSLTKYFFVNEDSTGGLTIDDVRQERVVDPFTAVQTSGEALSFGYTRSAYWLRLRVHNSSGRAVERLLEISYPILSDIQFHEVRADGSLASRVTGVARPFSTRAYPNRYFVFPVVVAPGTEQVIYLRVRSISAMQLPVRLWEPQAFHLHERNSYAVQAWYFGMVAVMGLFNFLLFLALRDAAYLLYSAFAICMAITAAGTSGLGMEFLWPEAPQWSDIAVWACFSLMLCSLLLFIRHILRSWERTPRLNRLILILAGILFLLPLEYATSARLVGVGSSIMYVVTVIAIFVYTVYCAAFLRDRLAMLLGLAYFVLAAGYSVMGLKQFGLLPVNVFTANALQIGSAMEMLLLAFLLAYRFSLIQDEAAHTVTQANAGLELRLQAREAELKQTHRLLLEIERRQTLSQERQRLMQDMHDGMGSSLTGALRMVERGKLDKDELSHLLRGCIDDLKLVIDSFESVDTDLLLLLATLRFRLEPRLEASSIVLRWDVQDLPPLEWLNPRNALHLLRILQEAFTNVIKHSKATEVRLSTCVQDDQVLVTVTDNGLGFSVAQAMKTGGKGLLNQQRRAEAIGAAVRWESGAAGTTTTLQLPIEQPQAAAKS